MLAVYALLTGVIATLAMLVPSTVWIPLLFNYKVMALVGFALLVTLAPLLFISLWIAYRIGSQVEL